LADYGFHEETLADDWEPQVRAYLSMLGPDDKADTMAAMFRVIEAWRIDSGLLPAPPGWILGNP
jgi:hypothetical protein